MRTKHVLFLFILISAISFSKENETENSLLTSDSSPKVSRVLQEILNRESLVRFSMTQKIQVLMLDAADSKKKTDMLFEKFQTVTREIQTLKDENQKQSEEISNLREEQVNLNKQIYQLQTNHSEGRTELQSHKQDYHKFSLSVNETLKDLQYNQSTADIRLMEQSGILMNSLRSFTKELEVENQKQKEDVTEVKNTLKNLNLQSYLIVKNLSSVADVVKTLDRKNQRQNKQVLELRGGHTNLSEDIQRLQTKQVDGESDVLSLKESYLKLSVLVNETLEHLWQNQSANNDQLRDTNGQTEIPGNFAFYSELSRSNSNGFVVFNKVRINEGSAYDEMTGIFTCKYSGAYAFSWTIATSSHRYTEAELLVNDEVIGSSGTDSRPSSDTADSSTGFVVCNLGVGDKVRIRVNGTADGNYSTFSGWRLPAGNSSLYARAMSQLNRPSTSSRGYPFQSVINNGNHYDSNTGIYTCPEDGLYAFTFTVEASNGRGSYVYLYRSGSQLSPFDIYPDPAGGNYVDTSSNLQIYSLSQGDTIYVYGYAIIEPLHSTFAAWRIGNTISDTPAFMGYTSSDTSSNPLIYNREVLDTSNSFNNTYFQAPKDGVYLFFWNMHAYYRRLESFLQVNDQTVGRTIGDGRTASFDSSSNLVIVRLHKNDNVKVMHDGRADGHQTMISGYFLFP